MRQVGKLLTLALTRSRALLSMLRAWLFPSMARLRDWGNLRIAGFSSWMALNRTRLMGWQFLGIAALVVVVGVVAVVLVLGTSPSVATTLISSFSTLVAAITAAGAWLTVREMRLDRLARTRPFVVVDFVITNSQAIYVTVRNLGSGVARNVSLQFDPEPIDFAGRRLSDLPIFQQPLDILPPNAELKQLFHIGPQLYSADIPRAFRVMVCYQGEGNTRYDRGFKIDLDRYREMVVPPKTPEESLEKLADSTADIYRLFKDVVKFGRLIVQDHEQWQVELRRNALAARARDQMQYRGGSTLQGTEC